MSENAAVRQSTTSTPVMNALRAAGQRAFVAFHWGGGMCLIEDAATQIEKKKKSFWRGLKAVVVEDPNACAAQGIFWAAIAALPLTLPLLSSQLKMNSSAGVAAGEVAGQEAGEAAGSPLAKTVQSGEGSGDLPFAKTVPQPAIEGEAAGKAAPGASPQAQSVNGPSPAAKSINGTSPIAEGEGEVEYVPPPRPLKEIEGDIEAANADYEAARNKYEVDNDAFMRQESAAKKAGQPVPERSDALDNELVDMIDKWQRVDYYRLEYLRNGGMLDRAGNPAGQFQLGEITTVAPPGPAPQPPAKPGTSSLATSVVGLDGLMGANK